jgi:hypothetical protein
MRILGLIYLGPDLIKLASANGACYLSSLPALPSFSAPCDHAADALQEGDDGGSRDAVAACAGPARG